MSLFLAAMRVAFLATGGGQYTALMCEYVHKRRWVNEGEFLSGLALAQAFPGVNVVNYAIWIGHQYRGGAGALVSALGMVVPPMFVAIALISLFDGLAHLPYMNITIAGLAIGAIGLSLAVALRGAKACCTTVAPALVVIAMFIALAVLKWPLVPVILVLAPLSVAFQLWRARVVAGKA